MYAYPKPIEVSTGCKARSHSALIEIDKYRLME